MNTESDLVPDPVRPIYLQLLNPTKSQPQTNPRGAQGPDKYIGSRVQDSSCVGHHMGEHMIEYFGEPATEKKKKLRFRTPLMSKAPPGLGSLGFCHQSDDPKQQSLNP